MSDTTTRRIKIEDIYSSSSMRRTLGLTINVITPSNLSPSHAQYFNDFQLALQRLSDNEFFYQFVALLGTDLNVELAFGDDEIDSGQYRPGTNTLALDLVDFAEGDVSFYLTDLPDGYEWMHRNEFSLHGLTTPDHDPLIQYAWVPGDIGSIRQQYYAVPYTSKKPVLNCAVFSMIGIH